uniref:Uncharacterized protein n=1 Tax=Anguilla anguilla TaxID=7936 RepID=A0A0E9S215_ANGAN
MIDGPGLYQYTRDGWAKDLTLGPHYCAHKRTTHVISFAQVMYSLYYLVGQNGQEVTIWPSYF